MKLLKTFTLLSLMGALSLTTSCSSDDDVVSSPVEENPNDETPEEEGVQIPDPILNSQIKELLGVADSDMVTEEDMLQLTELTIEGLNAFEVEDLTGLEYAKNLTYLRFGETGVTDLSPISGLEHIEYLRFNDTQISDLSPLSNYTSLTYFNANTATNITDISPLAGNTGLQEIILRNVPMGNEGMQTIAQLTSLYRINMRNTGVTDLTVLGELMANGTLQNDTPGAVENQGGAVIDVRELEVTDWRPVAGYVANIFDYSGPDFEMVSIADSRLEAQIKLTLEVSEETELNTLYMLSISELNLDGSEDLSADGDIREISDLSGLEYATNLTYLRFGETAVTDLSPIAGLENIEYLRLDKTDVSDLSPLSNYTSLTYFNANRSTNITNISPLANNTGLKEIILREIPFGNTGMATIANFTSLYRINMRETGVTDITVLGNLMAQGALLDSTPDAQDNGGADLDLRGLDVEDWSPIEPYLDQISNIEGYLD